jgi:hypothetical protein
MAAAPADVSVRDALLLRQIGDQLCAAALDMAPPAVRARGRLDQRRGFGAGTPSGIMISFRPPRRCRRIGMRLVKVLYQRH